MIVVSGEAIFLSGDTQLIVSPGQQVKIPRGMPHGFEINEGNVLKFVSIQNPPIKDHFTGEEDLHLYELV